MTRAFLFYRVRYCISYRTENKLFYFILLFLFLYFFSPNLPDMWKSSLFPQILNFFFNFLAWLSLILRRIFQFCTRRYRYYRIVSRLLRRLWGSLVCSYNGCYGLSVLAFYLLRNLRSTGIFRNVEKMDNT